MFKTSKFTKATAIALTTTMLVSSLGTTVTASAHDRRHPETHGYDYYDWNKHTHRNFHRTYGPGYEGEENYRYQHGKQYKHDPYKKHQQTHQHKKHKDKKRADRAAIAIGIIGLAAGAIIASQAAKNRQNQTTYRAPAPQPNYQYGTPQRQSFDQYSSTGEPNVVTFRDTASLEPWTPGWREWCSSRYRSFNQSTGTYRGFDGLDHFCVPN